MNKTLISTLILVITLCVNANAQGLLQEKNKFTHQDTLRGSITPEREWWDLTYYHLDIKVNPETKTIAGKNTIQYTVLKPNQVLQIDLQEPLVLTKVTQNDKALEIKHDGNAHFVTLKDQQNIGETNSVIAYYEGKPREAIRAPWDGGISWKKDNNGNHFIASSCQGLGASVWWPNKDHMYDEVDSMDISVTVPKGLMNVSNGRLKSVIDNKDETITTNWHVANPINNYGVNINIGNYVNFSEVYKGEKGDLDMNYFVLKENLEKAKAHFKDAPKMMKAFEHWFGPYPFYEDSFKLVEVPYLGMEHQSSVTYGNKYMNGYLGDDLSGTGWGLKFDFIIIHESGHEWFANNITNIDIADMWIHESFTSYSENLFLDYYYGKEAAAEYVIGKRKNIRNDRPLIGQYNVNNEGSGDMYYKGENMLHTLRQLVNDDEKWRQILRTLNSKFYHQTVTTQQIEDCLTEASDLDLKGFFNQYLRTTKIPAFEYKVYKREIKFNWNHVVDNFNMPIEVLVNGKSFTITPSDKEVKSLKFDSDINTFEVDKDYYINSYRVK
ncbi:M1 family metallopeptidase [Olleya namhaensis]|uniref:M1 family metallopeptidase n=1 Tax=Olleya namhaensis TaxID=1144750 RepID=UPI0024925F7C|nr:M1 family metallopeptidase [Olleya namhaensis]